MPLCGRRNSLDRRWPPENGVVPLRGNRSVFNEMVCRVQRLALPPYKARLSMTRLLTGALICWHSVLSRWLRDLGFRIQMREEGVRRSKVKTESKADARSKWVMVE
jgi:hypothetical protein